MAWQNLLLAFLALKYINLAMTQVFRSECRRNAAFVATDRGKALSHDSAGVLQTFQSVSYLFCGMRCTANNNYKSLNFKDAVESVCEILSFNKATLGATMKSSPGWKHYEPDNQFQVGPRCHHAACGLGYKCIESCSNKMGYECLDLNKCQSSPCKNGGSCSNLVNMYRCECLPGYTGLNCETAQNIALNMPSSQSSTSIINEVTLHARFGNDGDRTGEWQRCSITKNDDMPWWQVDLTRQAAVIAVQIKNGQTWAPHRINPFKVSVGDDSSNGGRNNALCVDDGTLNAGEFKYFYCPTVLHGRYVTVFLNRIEILQICELEVYEGIGD